MSRSQGSLLVPMLSFSGQLKLGLYNHQLRIGLTFTTTNQKSIFPKPSTVYQSETGVSKSRYFARSIAIKYSNFRYEDREHHIEA